MLEELEKLVRTKKDCKKLFGFGKDIVTASFEEPSVVENFQNNFGLIHHNVGAIFNYFTDLADKQSKFDCRAGCNYCCHLRVTVSPLEVLAAARYIRDTFTGSQLEDLLQKLNDNVKTISGKSSKEHTALKLPCALLDTDGKCSIYEKRPFSCRRWLSYQVEDCRTAFNSPSGNGEVPLNASIYALGFGVEEALLMEFAKRGLNDNYYELQSALLYALDDESAESNWCTGKDSFQKCIPYESER